MHLDGYDRCGAGRNIAERIAKPLVRALVAVFGQDAGRLVDINLVARRYGGVAFVIRSIDAQKPDALGVNGNQVSCCRRTKERDANYQVSGQNRVTFVNEPVGMTGVREIRLFEREMSSLIGARRFLARRSARYCAGIFYLRVFVKGIATREIESGMSEL
jgi:hypothetical protein